MGLGGGSVGSKMKQLLGLTMRMMMMRMNDDDDDIGMSCGDDCSLILPYPW